MFTLFSSIPTSDFIFVSKSSSLRTITRPYESHIATSCCFNLRKSFPWEGRQCGVKASAGTSEQVYSVGTQQRGRQPRRSRHKCGLQSKEGVTYVQINTEVGADGMWTKFEDIPIHGDQPSLSAGHLTWFSNWRNIQLSD